MIDKLNSLTYPATTSTAAAPLLDLYLNQSLPDVPSNMTASPMSDMIHRAVVTTSFTLTQSWRTSDVQKYFWEKDRDIETLSRYAAWQRKYIDYQATYSAYLLGALTDEEFEADSAQYAPTLRDVDCDSLSSEISRLSRLLNFELRPAELAEFFETDQQAVMRAWAQAQMTLPFNDVDEIEDRLNSEGK